MKILATHVPAGSGHQRAAEAVVAAIQKLNPSIETHLVDALEHSDPWYRWAFTTGYLDLIQRAPFLWGVMYHLTDLKPFGHPAQWLHRLSNNLHGSRLESFFIGSRPDVILGTHFFPMEVAGTLKAAGRISSKLVTVITDYLPHTLWIAPGIDIYVVGSPQARQELISRGVQKERIQILGIPVNPKFTQPIDRSFRARQLGLDPEQFTILIGSGGAGTGPVEKLIHLLGKMEGPIQLLAVAGKNGSLYRNLENLRPHFPHLMKVFGFIETMDELMGISDLIISKPGGLTCAEALIKGLPMILIEPIPGQEGRNAHVLEEMGVAVLARQLEQVPKRVQEFREHPNRLHEMSRKAHEAGRPDAAENIAKLAIQ